MDKDKAENKDVMTEKKGSQGFTNKFKLIALGVLAVIILGTSLLVYFNYSKSYVAKLGNEKISVAEFNFFLTQQKNDMLRQADNPDPATFWNSKIGGEEAIEVAKNKALESAKELKVQVIKAKELKINLDKNDIKSLDDGIKEIIVQSNNSKVEANKQFVATYGVDLDEFKEIYKEFILSNKLYQQEYEALTVTEDDFPVYYEKYSEEYKRNQFRINAEEAVWARHILIKTVNDDGEALPQEKQDEAKKKAEEVLTKARNGEDFIQLVKDNSQDTGSIETGGAYVFSKGTMMPEFEDAAFNKLKPGQISDLVKTSYGYHIIKLEEKYAKDEPASLRCVKEYFEFGLNSIKALKFQEKLDGWKSEYQSSLKINKKVYESFS